MNYFFPANRITLAAIVLGFAADCVLGDPQNSFHPVRIYGNMISFGSDVYMKLFRTKLFSETGQKRAGNVLGFIMGTLISVSVVAFAFFSAAALLSVAYSFNFIVGFVLESFCCYLTFAAKSLYCESMKVYCALKSGNLILARKRLSYIVGRDTQRLDEAGVVRAAVETVAENLSDGVIAPMMFLFIGGVPLGLAYKAVNTLDSMIGYNDERYRYFGKFAARLDDAVNLIPARFSAVVMILSVALSGFDGKGAARVYMRDRYKHKSPNSAHTESVCAGALGIALGGDNSYNGVKVSKPFIGDALRQPEVSDIVAANKIMYVTSVASLLLGVIVYAALSI